MMFFRSFGGGIEIRGGGSSAPIVDDYDDNHQQQQRMAGFLLTKQHPQQLHDDHHLALPLRLQHQHQHQHQQKPECYSDEVDSRSGDGGAADSEPRLSKRQRKLTAKAAAAASPQGAKASRGGSGAEDGAAVEVMRRPRGRPPGSKNKPKPPIVITRDADDPSSPAAMRPHVLEVSAGQDVVDALSSFARRRNLGLCVLAGTGLVSNVVFRQPSASTSAPDSADLSFPGHFDILSISATFLPPSFAPSPPTSLPEGGGEVSVSLAGPQGQVFGGLVVGPLTAAGTVTILAASFCNPTYHLLPAEDEVSVSVSVSGSGDVEAARAHAPQASPHQRHQHINTPSERQQHPQQPQPHNHPHRQQRRSTSPPSSSSAAAAAAGAAHHQRAPTLAAAEVCGTSIYSCHLPSDVIWTPAARSPY